ncbi:hypothetical protein G5T42_15550 [Microbacterium sp. 4R-513]|uniref:PH-like domain-containing protein n=1 Tax=Microbacterium sp. 4R-513 TaxID=2567934 RepID=UPI0013E1A7DA|nr:hypothetical protein [Microbacterium sp. 4R-513]QIG40710.1 hypothetical protein G5T42_15550 [Microbacterium sp. 4R-513]
MTQQGALLVMIAVAAVLLALLVWGWSRRVRRDQGLTAPQGEIPAGGAVTAVFPGLYVATTKHREPLERLAIGGLGFRSKADVTVTDRGVAIDLTGQPRVFLAAERIAGVAQATVAIDRVVEPDGLVRLEWRTDGGTVVDSYFRPQEASARALADAIADILTPTTTGPDA